ncbi:MAG: MBL fold metallo-hydrolase [Candidatus Aenigmarchaeota archaeon]|nr:MBL fold metallo-hydrolase [Candidatus Aenigmarchaeota archaeon]
MEVKILGSGNEVGRASIMLTSEKKRFLFDHGVNVKAMDYPIEPKMPIDAVFLSHAHLDHSGNLPHLYKRGYNGKIFATPTTFDLTNMLLRDSLKVQKLKGLTPQYMPDHMNQMGRRERGMRYREKIKIGQAVAELRGAGHTPGSSTTLLEVDGKRILYTGDINFIETELLRPADTKFKDIDMLITEATYTYKDHPDRKKLGEELRKKAADIINSGGTLIMPSFAVGRTQEMLLILSKLDFPIYMDGMGIDATRRAMLHTDSVRNIKKLRNAFSKAQKISRPNQRKKAIEKPSIVITTSGMLSGGPVNWYIKNLHKREDCSLILSGFQCENTTGRTLLDTGRYINEGLDIKPKFNIEFMDFSSHCGRSDLINFIKNVNAKKTILVHTESGPKFANELKDMNIDAVAPKNGEIIGI